MYKSRPSRLSRRICHRQSALSTTSASITTRVTTRSGQTRPGSSVLRPSTWTSSPKVVASLTSLYQRSSSSSTATCSRCSSGRIRTSTSAARQVPARQSSSRTSSGVLWTPHRWKRANKSTTHLNSRRLTSTPKKFRFLLKLRLKLLKMPFSRSWIVDVKTRSSLCIRGNLIIFSSMTLICLSSTSSEHNCQTSCSGNCYSNLDAMIDRSLFSSRLTTFRWSWQARTLVLVETRWTQGLRVNSWCLVAQSLRWPRWQASSASSCKVTSARSKGIPQQSRRSHTRSAIA